ncbi:MAG: ferrous iron transport protein B [Kiritimatiellia bacterium]|jgi:ferrous iron transport protein B
MNPGHGKLKVGLVGNPNCGKSTVFNALTGSKQHIGNWPGVTVERKAGTLRLSGGVDVEVVDLPGIYSLIPGSEDERVAVEYVLGGEADLLVNVIDGTNLERNLYLTLLLAELGVPMLHVVTMMDRVKHKGIDIDFERLEESLGSPVVGVNIAEPEDRRLAVKAIGAALKSPACPKLKIAYPEEVEREIAALEPACAPLAEAMDAPPRWVATGLLEGDPRTRAHAFDMGLVAEEAVEAACERISAARREFPDESLANARYDLIQRLCHDVVRKAERGEGFSEKADRIILNRWLGIPFFLFVMYGVFWITQVIGGAFIAFFEILGGTIFVEGPTALMARLGAPPFLIALVASGLGTGLQTMATFLPPIFLMFLCLAILEDSGYMARAAFVMDRFMRWLGLPGKSFVPLLVGFGCSVPAIMATRALSSRRDRFLTIFMTPFMSCGAKLPIYVVFGAAFFADSPGRLVFWIYLAGMALGIVTGLLLKRTLFRGEPSPFILELPPYHVPRLKPILRSSWDRLRIFIFRAGRVIVPMVLILGVFNTVGLDGSIGHDDTDKSVLAVAGKALTPVFEPMGVEADNWPATVAIFSGLFAKEAVIGTMTSLYGQNAEVEAAAAEPTPVEPYTLGHLWRGVRAAFATIPEAFSNIADTLLDPLGLRDISGDEAAVAASADTQTSVFANLRAAFPRGRHQAFAYLLFILLYMPCLAAMGAALRELGAFYGVVMMTYLTVLGWSVATLHYQITLAREPLWIAVPTLLLAAIVASFAIMGRRRKVRLI